MRWLLEPNVFGEGPHPMTTAVERAGHEAIRWDDDWWDNNRFPVDDDSPTLFHGSLGNAARIAQAKRWWPGAYCEVSAFCCSTWYPSAARWMIQRQYVLTTVKDLIERPHHFGGQVGESERIFVRPDSPLKPFSGRVVRLENLSLEDLDHGFYYEDIDLPVVVLGISEIFSEYRFIVAGQDIVSGSSYQAEGRVGSEKTVPSVALEFARDVASTLEPPELVYVLDVGETEEGVGLVELNPFSGADLYGCDYETIIQSIEALL